jgi:signal transduction histidine kinase
MDMFSLFANGREFRYSNLSRAERLIAAGRVVLAGFSLLAIWLEPTEPTRYAQLTYTILLMYLFYAVVLALVTWLIDVFPLRTHIISHVLDMMVFAAIMFFTEGPASPFFAYFVFSLVCAALRWQWRGTLWTAVVALATASTMALYPTHLFREPNFELKHFIIRIVYLAVVAGLLGFLGVHEQKLRSVLSRLAAWPRTIPAEVASVVREMLEHAAGILESPRMLLVWEEEGEPQLHLALWSPGDFQYTREPPGLFGSQVAEPLAGTSFICHDARSPSATVMHKTPAGLNRWQGTSLHPGLQERFSIRSVLSLTLLGAYLKGRLFALDKPGMTSDDLVQGEIVANEVLDRLDHFYLLKQFQQGAAAEERIRLARDLHDGLLQSLTGAALQLETVQRLMEADPQKARQRLLEIQRLIAAEQRDLRSQIRELKPTPSGLPVVDSSLAGRLEELGERIRRHWGLQVQMKVNLAQLEGPIPGSLAQGIYFIVHESMVNAARHSRASAVWVDLAVEENQVRIMVSDNGRGFTFRGQYDHHALIKMNLGPVTLKERIASLGGTLGIESSDFGARLEIILPLTKRGG